jgi:hypothetical protein
MGFEDKGRLRHRKVDDHRRFEEFCWARQGAGMRDSLRILVIWQLTYALREIA